MAQLSYGAILSNKLKNGLISYSRYLRLMKARVERTREEMHKYQAMAVEFCKANPFCALFIDLGLGKTVISLTLATDLLLDGEVTKVLVVGPRRVAHKTWPDEIAAWAHTALWDFQVIAGTPKQREDQVQSKADIHIISRDNFEWLVMHFKSEWPYDMLIIDESSAFKDHKTKRFKAANSIRKYLKRMVQLTATPAAESYIHLFAQIYLLDGGARFGKTITNFAEQYFTLNQWSRKYKLRDGAKEVIAEKISDICLVMRAEDYLDLEKPVFINRHVEMTAKETEVYKQMETDMVIEVLGTGDRPVVIEAETAAALSSKLLQMASGVIYNTYIEGLDAKGEPLKHREVHQFHDHKLDMLEEMMDNELAEENVLVAYHFQSSLEKLKKRFPYAKQMDANGDCIGVWNKGKIRMLLAHPQSAGHGLNLQKGGKTIVFFDIPHSLELYLQFIGRLARQGQTGVVRVYHLMTQGIFKGKVVNTADHDVVRALGGKEEAQDWLKRRILRIWARERRKREKAARLAA